MGRQVSPTLGATESAKAIESLKKQTFAIVKPSSTFIVTEKLEYSLKIDQF
jgi:hypothetical protein